VACPFHKWKHHKTITDEHLIQAGFTDSAQNVSSLKNLLAISQLRVARLNKPDKTIRLTVLPDSVPSSQGRKKVRVVEIQAGWIEKSEFAPWPFWVDRFTCSMLSC
jgi:hypothetical protein